MFTCATLDDSASDFLPVYAQILQYNKEVRQFYNRNGFVVLHTDYYTPNHVTRAKHKNNSVLNSLVLNAVPEDLTKHVVNIPDQEKTPLQSGVYMHFVTETNKTNPMLLVYLGQAVFDHHLNNKKLYRIF